MMARFSQGDRVRVRHNEPNAPPDWQGRVGTITFVNQPIRELPERPLDCSRLEQEYMIKFDRMADEQVVWEPWLEPAITQEARTSQP